MTTYAPRPARTAMERGLGYNPDLTAWGLVARTFLEVAPRTNRAQPHTPATLHPATPGAYSKYGRYQGRRVTIFPDTHTHVWIQYPDSPNRVRVLAAEVSF